MSQLMKEVLSTVAADYDRMMPGTGDAVRKFAEEEYPDRRPTHVETMQHLANLCDRHKRDLLPRPTVFTCLDCEVEQGSDE